MNKPRLLKSAGWWNVITVDGYVLASYDYKPMARMYCKISSRVRPVNGNVARAVQKHFGKSMNLAAGETWGGDPAIE